MLHGYIAFEIQAEIIKKLPFKSLIRFRSVSKAWKSLIHSHDFITYHSNHSIKVPYILLTYDGSNSSMQNNGLSFANDGYNYNKHTYVSIVDDETFPLQKVSLTLPRLVKMLQRPSVIGCSHGLLCLYNEDDCYSGNGTFVLWNLSIGNAVAVVVRDYVKYETVLGFGVCRETMDPKIVMITHGDSAWDNESVNFTPLEVKVFALSTGAWRRPRCNLPSKSVKFYYRRNSVDVGGVLYWLACDTVIADCQIRSKCNLLVSFDITTEEFREVNLSDRLAPPYDNLSIYKLRESLVVYERDIDVVWMMEDGVPKTFTKLFVIRKPYPPIVYVFVRGFRKTGEPLVQTEEYPPSPRLLGVYDPVSKRVHNIEIDGIHKSFSVHSYTETLLLLDQPNDKVFDTKILKKRG
ncbi:hypothetical protein QVD17_35314 [Tagetes erecta]|uniref:F-box domain-containing protein n=1 Tax=Tagetes erecta TaxID=13708 RepID=A0AAD8NL38_TARER|nr:hypothetical protein QVD17_35314 [Tagetes erecta]